MQRRTMLKKKMKKENILALKKFLDGELDELEIIVDEDTIMFSKPYELLIIYTSV